MRAVHPRGMRCLALTGGIGMGKSTALALLRRQGWQTLSSDALAHDILAQDNACTRAIRARYPDTVGGPRIDRQKLGAHVFADPAALRWLEALLHPAISAQRVQRLRTLRRRGITRAVCEVPLLFETGMAHEFSASLAVYAPRFMQQRRVLARPGMTQEKWQGILRRQWAAPHHKGHADHAIPAGLGKAATMRALKKALHALRAARKI